ncbi:MAG: hypothetical protein EHM21_05020 [Chloroflexi bacterium]|nr:MAG: hypothetical protein EHM21_05020 [Chloroflexota bacterium]
MLPNNQRQNQNVSDTLASFKPGLLFVVMILGALIAFEIFNFSTTEHALTDLLGDLSFIGLPWSTVLALAFCGIDFAGIARLFTPEQGADEPKEVWYLFGAWLLAATMNAILTWWGVSMAVASHPVQSSAVVDPGTIITIVPVFVAIMVWVIRILIIGTLSLAIDRLMHPGAEQRTALQNALEASRYSAASQQSAASARQPRQPAQPTQPMNIPASLNSAGIPPRPGVSRSMSGAKSTRPSYAEEDEFSDSAQSRPDPTYHSLSMSARPQVRNGRGSNPNENTGVNQYRR